jgi:hypothetical protein
MNNGITNEIKGRDKFTRFKIANDKVFGWRGVVIYTIRRENLKPLLDESFGNFSSDESGRTGDENFHQPF